MLSMFLGLGAFPPQLAAKLLDEEHPLGQAILWHEGLPGRPRRNALRQERTSPGSFSLKLEALSWMRI